MGSHPNVGYDIFPEQSSDLKREVAVVFDGNIGRVLRGRIVRDDRGAPWQTIIFLEDGRYITAQECQYSTSGMPPPADKVQFCNWCPSPRTPSKEFHPDGRAAHVQPPTPDKERDDLLYEMWALLCNSQHDGHGVSGVADAWKAQFFRLRDRYHALNTQQPEEQMRRDIEDNEQLAIGDRMADVAGAGVDNFEGRVPGHDYVSGLHNLFRCKHEVCVRDAKEAAEPKPQLTVVPHTDLCTEGACFEDDFTADCKCWCHQDSRDFVTT